MRRKAQTFDNRRAPPLRPGRRATGGNVTFRRLFLLAGTLFILLLGVYSWNQRTQVLDTITTNVGLEAAGGVLSGLRAVQDSVADIWSNYFALVDVRQENLALKERVRDLEARLMAQGESLAELKRLRQLLQMPTDQAWRPVGARVLSGRLGPNGVLDSISINRGYATGGRPGTPLVTNLGLVGRILRSSAHTATALLLTDPSSRIAVLAQESRSSGILTGQGPGRVLEVSFMERGTDVNPGEILITSGLDGKFPKGIPVARVLSVAPSNYSQFLAIQAEPLVDLRHLEEVLMLEPTGVSVPTLPLGPPPVFVGPPAPGRTSPSVAPDGSTGGPRLQPSR